MKVLMKKDVFGSRKQCIGPIDSAIPVKNLDVQRGSGSRAQCTGPTGRSVSHVKCASGIFYFIFYLKKKRKTQAPDKLYPNAH